MGSRKRLQMKLLFGLAVLLLLMIGSTAAESCTSSTCQLCSTLCAAANQDQVLGNQSETAQVMCTSQGVGAVTWDHSGMTIDTSTSNPKYGGSGNRLDIFNVVPSDEGRYQCSYTQGGTTATACVFVLGTAVFASCRSQTCPMESSTVLAGGEIVIDARIMFINSGTCMIPQNTTFLQVFQGTVASENLVYNCSTVCPNSSGPYRAVSDGSHKFGINVTKASAMMDDGGIYIVRVRISNPKMGFAIISKTMSISVNGSLPSATSTVISGPPTSSSQSFPTTSSTQLTSTPIPSAGMTGPVGTGPPGMMDVVAIAVPVSVAVFLVVVFVIVIVVVACVVRSSSQKGSHRLLTIRQTTQQNSYFRAASVVTTETIVEERKVRDSVIEPYEYYEAEDPAKSSEDHDV